MRSSGAYKVQQSLDLIRRTQQNIETAPCEQLDEAMAYTYLHHKVLSDKRVMRASPSQKRKQAKTMSLFLVVQLTAFKEEYTSRCKGEPIRAEAMKKLYPELSRIAFEISEKKKKRMKQH
jgi:hypothetical protein